MGGVAPAGPLRPRPRRPRGGFRGGPRAKAGNVEFTERAYADYPGATARQRRNREILREAMEAEGFVVYPYEWWHFDYQGGRYPIMNVRFDEIRSMTVARGSDE